MAVLDYDTSSHMIPINITDPLYCCSEAKPGRSPHHGEPVGVIVHAASMAVTICGWTGRTHIPRRGSAKNDYRGGEWPGDANVVHQRQGTTVDRCFVSACTAV